MILHFKKYGDSDKPVICIIHGLFGTLDNWHNISRDLASDYCIVAVDLRNHGKSDHMSSMTYDEMADDVIDTLKGLGIEHANFIGHSMGGKVLMKLIELHPDKVDKMMIVDIAPKAYAPGHLELFEAMFSLPLSIFKSRAEIDDALAASIPDDGVRLFLMKNIERQKEGGFAWKLNLKEIYAHYPDIIDEVVPSWPIDHQVLFVKGEKSNYINSNDEDEILNSYPNAKFVEISGAGHWVNADNPDEFVSVVRHFITT